MFLLDTNIFLEILLDQAGAPAAYQKIQELSADEIGVVTGFSLHAIAAILSRRRLMEELNQVLSIIEEHPFLSRYDTSTEEEKEIASLSFRLSLDFDDTLQYYVAKKLGLTLVTFDKDFLKVKGVPILHLK